MYEMAQDRIGAQINQSNIIIQEIYLQGVRHYHSNPIQSRTAQWQEVLL